jgi:hypothetical protein
MAQPIVDLTDEQLDALIAQKQGAAKGAEKPSVAEDIKKVAPAAATRGIAQAVTTVPTVADLALRGLVAGSNYLAGPGNRVGGVASQLHEGVEPYTYEGVMPSIESHFPSTAYQAQTTPGKYVQSGLEWAPSVAGSAAMAEKFLPSMAKGMLASQGSEAAGEGTQGSSLEPYARIAGAVAAHSAPAGVRSAVTPFAALPERNRMADLLASNGVPISAADRSGSRLASTLEGAPPGGQSGALSDAMMSKGGVTRPPGSALPTSDLIAARGNQLSSAVQNLEQNTDLQVTPGLQHGLANIVGQHRLAYGGTSLENPDVEKALTDFSTLSSTGQLSGKQYHALSDSWKNSGVPELRNMGSQLDSAIDSSNNGSAYNGAWQKWRGDWADFQGLKAASEAAGGKGTTGPLSPGPVVGAMMKNTPVKQLAEAGQGILGTRPQPYSMSWLPPAAATAGAAGGLYAHNLEAGVLGALAPYYIDTPLKMIGKGINAIAKSAPAQAYAQNQMWLPSPATSLDPASAIRLLSMRAPDAAQAALNQPQQGQ